MMNRVKYAMPVAALLAAVALPSQALVTITDNASMIQASAFAGVGSPFNFDLDNPLPFGFSETGIPSSFGDTLTLSASATDNDGPSTADLSSTIAVDISQVGQVVTFDMDLNYTTSQSASPGNPEFDRANAEGSTVIELVFDLDIDYNYDFSFIDAQASGTPELEFRLEGPGGFSTSLQNETNSGGIAGSLAAGTGYKIIINVDDSDNMGSADGASAMGLADVESALLVLTPVPEPSSLALLGLGGLALIRRRRA